MRHKYTYRSKTMSDRHLEFFKSRSQTRVRNEFKVRSGYKPNMSAISQNGDMVFQSSCDGSHMQKNYMGRKKTDVETYRRMRRKKTVKS